MKIRNITALILILVMLLAMFTACGEKEKETDGGTSSQPSSNPSDSTPDDGGEEQEIEEISFWLTLASSASDDMDEVYAAINEITEREIGIRVNFNAIAFADYNTQLTLAVANNEQIDICAVAANFVPLYSAGILADITDLLDNHGQDIKAMLGDELLNTTTVNGRLYSITNYRACVGDGYILYRKDVLESAGMLDKAQSMTTWADFEEVLEAVKGLGETYAFGGQSNMMYNIVYSGTNITDSYMYDYLGDNSYLIWTNQQGEVDLIYNRPEVADMYKMIASWYQKGYYYPDSAIETQDMNVSIGQKMYAGAFNMSIYGVEATKSEQIGTDMLCVKIADGYMQTSSGRTFGTGIATTSANPEAAMKFLNYMYQSSEIMNLIVWGIEGKHYVVNDAGEATYLEGKDASSSGYHHSDFFIGNAFECLPWEGQGGNFRAEALAATQNAARSVYCGLSVDTADYATLIANITAVRGEYYNQINHGQYSDSLYNEYLNKLDSAGVQDYVALYADAVAEFMK